MNLLRAGDYAAAEDKFRRAIEINPRANAWWGLMLAKTHIQSDDKITAVALAVWKRAIEDGKRTPPPLPFDCEYGENALALATTKTEREKYVAIITETRNACADLWEESGRVRPTFPEIGGSLGKSAIAKAKAMKAVRYSLIGIAVLGLGLVVGGLVTTLTALTAVGITASALAFVLQYLTYVLYFKAHTESGFKFAILTGALASFGQLILGIGLGSVTVLYSGIAFIAVFCAMMILETVLEVIRRKKK